VPPLSFTTRLLASLAATTALVVGVAACGGGEGTGDRDPETEGVTVYSGRIPPLIGPAIDLYEERFDRDVQVRFGDSAPLAATVVEEGDNSPADVFFAQDAGSLGALEAAGLLAPLPDRVLDRVPARFRSDDGEWVGVTGRARVIAYGSDVERAELPDSPLELTDPSWRGRVGWAPSNASLQAYVTALRINEGEEVAREWLEGMVANDVQAYESNVPVRDAVASGEIDVGLINHYYVAQAIEEHGEDYPVGVHFPPEDLGSFVNVAGATVLASSDRQEEAFGFIEFMLSPPAQRYFAASSKEYPLARGISPDPDVPPFSRIPSQRVDLSNIEDLEGTLELMRETGAL
jgi:iron(III) transport system substrate-binding protein